MADIPPSVLLSSGIFAGFTIFYYKTAQFFPTDKQRAYILSTLSSFVMTAISLPFVWIYLTKGLETVFENGQSGLLGMIGWFGVVFFLTYLFADLAIGYLMYPSQIGLLTGWIHHTVYIGIMFHLLMTRLSPMFLIPAVMELPTFDLAISHLFPAVRNDGRFLSLMFLTRILFHAIYLVHCALPSSRAIGDDSWVPTAMLSLALILHVGWFRGGLNGYLKRRAALKRGEKPSKSIDDDAEIREKVLQEDTLLSAAAGIDQTILSTFSEPSTPDDSPLVTPYTPSQTPMTIRDTYFPNIHIPTLPNLPVMAIPPIPSFSDLASGVTASLNKEGGLGFTKAVKEQWETERGRFAGMRGGMAGLDLGALRLRRRERAGAIGKDHGTVGVREVLAG